MKLIGVDVAKSKTINISIADFLYLAYVIRLLSGDTPRQLIERFLAGNVKAELIQAALRVMDRLEVDGVEITLSASFVLLVKTWYKKALGGKTLLKLGPLRIKP